MTKWSFFYELLRFFVRNVFKLFYKQIQSQGIKNIPSGKPIIFAANHQNALMDPLAIIFTNPNQSVFLTRADIFNNPLLLKIFTFLKMLPVYRIRDGADSLKNNDRIFNQSVEILKANMSVALFPEATHTDQRHLRPLKKAVPRIAFLAEERNHFNLDLQIIPVGIYYEHYTHSNNNLFVNYGEPISLKPFESLYRENNQKAFLALKEKLEEAMIPLIIHIKDMDNYELYESIRILYRPIMRNKLKLRKNNPQNNFNADQKTIKQVQEYYNNSENDISELKDKFTKLNKEAKQLGLQPTSIYNISFGALTTKIILLLIALPIAVFGFINNFIYYLLVMKFIKKIKDQQFHTSIKFGLALLASPLVYLIHSIGLYFICGNFVWALLYFISLPISAYILNIYRYSLLSLLDDGRYYFSKKSKPFVKFKASQEEIIEHLNHIIT